MPVPHTIGACGHVVCLLCLEVLLLSDEDRCPVCRHQGLAHVLNVALAAYSEDMFLLRSTDTGTTATPAALSFLDAFAVGPRKPKACTAAMLPEVAAQCAERAEAFLETANKLRATSAEMTAAVAHTCAAYEAAIDAQIAALNVQRQKTLQDMDSLMRQRQKLLQTDIDQAEVSAAHARVCVAMGQYAQAHVATDPKKLVLISNELSRAAAANAHLPEATPHATLLFIAALGEDSTFTVHDPITACLWLAQQKKVYVKVKRSAKQPSKELTALTEEATSEPAVHHEATAYHFCHCLSSILGVRKSKRQAANASVMSTAAVVVMMGVHLTSRRVQHAGLSVLGCVQVTKGSLPCVLAAMDAFQDDEEMMIAACDTIYHVLCNTDHEDDDQLDGISRLCGAMKTYPTSGLLAITAVRSMSRAAMDRRQEMVVTACFDRVWSLMAANPKHKQVQEYMSEALMCLLHGQNGLQRTEIIANNKLPLVFAAMALPNLATAHNSIGALKLVMMGDKPKSLKAALQAGCLQSVLNVMEHFPRNMDIQQVCCELLIQVSMLPEGITSMRAIPLSKNLVFAAANFIGRKNRAMAYRVHTLSKVIAEKQRECF